MMGRRILHFLGGFAFFLGLILLFFPNACNRRENLTFSGEERLSGSTLLDEKNDSLKLFITSFYSRNDVVHFFLGSHYRDMWSTPVTLPVFNGSFDSLRFEVIRTGGGQQTTSLKLKDQYGRSFTLRSVDKDQSRALPYYLRKTGIRTLFRDQGSALNPYAAPVAIALGRIARVPTTSARLFVIPEVNQFPDSIQPLVKNRVMLLEIEPDNSWKDSEYFEYPLEVIDTEEMLERFDSGLHVDALQYAYCRLFDILIGDWDRHADQWMWSVDSLGTVHAIPMDRDMAFYKFNDGLVNRLALHINPKFQTFEPEFSNLNGYLINGQEIDSIIQPGVERRQWDSLAVEFQRRLSQPAVHSGFRQYPKEIFERYGDSHQAVLLERLKIIDSAAALMHRTLHSK